MAGRSRHGLHVVRGDGSPAAAPGLRLTEDGGTRPYLSLHQQSVVLCIGGLLNADTASRLRVFLSMFTVDGGPAELVLDLAAVQAVDEDGMAPIREADESMRLRQGSLRLVSVSPAVTQHLEDDGRPRPGGDRPDR